MNIWRLGTVNRQGTLRYRTIPDARRAAKTILYWTFAKMLWRDLFFCKPLMARLFKRSQRRSGRAVRWKVDQQLHKIQPRSAPKPPVVRQPGESIKEKCRHSRKLQGCSTESAQGAFLGSYTIRLLRRASPPACQVLPSCGFLR